MKHGNLREARTGKGLTQRQVADKLGVTRVSVARWERGSYEPSPRAFGALVDLLDLWVEVETLVDCRAVLGLTQSDFAERVESTTWMVSMVEAGNLFPANAELWAKELDIDLETFEAMWVEARCGDSSTDC